MHYVSLQKVAKITGFSRNMILRFIQEGKLPYIKRRNRIYIDEEKIASSFNKIEAASTFGTDDLQRFIRNKERRYSL
jgi:predicted site-specific integrase-resolvase